MVYTIEKTEEMKDTHEEWREVLEGKWLEEVKQKLKYIEYEYGDSEHGGNGERKVINLIEVKFKYL